MSETNSDTYHITSEENRMKESRISRANDGQTPKDSEPSLIKSKLQQQENETETKAEKIERVKANLPWPEDPPTASDWNSADARTAGAPAGG